MDNNTIRILHIFSGVGGGISTWIRKAAIYSGDKYTIDAMAFSITDKSNFISIIESNGGRCYEMPRIRKGVIKLLKYISSTINNGNYDLVHCHIDGYGAIPFWVASHVICRKPIIIHSHRTAIEKIAGRKFEKTIYGFNRAINRIISKYKVACGEKAAEFAYGKTKRIKILHNGIDPVDQEIVTDKKSEDQINILALGRLNHVKNHEFMLEISKQLKSMGVQFHLFIVGDGELRNVIAEKIQTQKLEEYVSLEGYCDTPSIYLRKCDFLIMPSFSEGLPTVMLEAQEYGCRVISSNTVTRECDLNLEMVSFKGISEADISEWANEISFYGKKRTMYSVEELNNALAQKGFINRNIYIDYYKYARKIVRKR